MGVFQRAHSNSKQVAVYLAHLSATVLPLRADVAMSHASARGSPYADKGVGGRDSHLWRRRPQCFVRPGWVEKMLEAYGELAKAMTSAPSKPELVLACSQRDDDVLEHARGRPVMAGRAALGPWAGWVMKTGDPLCAPFSGGASKARLALHSRVVRSTLGVPSPAQVAALPSACSHRQLPTTTTSH